MNVSDIKFIEGKSGGMYGLAIEFNEHCVLPGANMHCGCLVSSHPSGACLRTLHFI